MISIDFVNISIAFEELDTSQTLCSWPIALQRLAEQRQGGSTHRADSPRTSTLPCTQSRGAAVAADSTVRGAHLDQLPGFTRLTPAPTASTMPAPSCPRTPEFG